MLSRQARLFVAVRRSVNAIRNSSHHAPVPEKYKHLAVQNFSQAYPLPTVLYSEAYAAQQARYNKYLFLSVCFLSSAIAFVKINNTFDYLAPPPKKVLNWK